jgi:hypothetical protein
MIIWLYAGADYAEKVQIVKTDTGSHQAFGCLLEMSFF